VRTLQKTYSQIVHAVEDGRRVMLFDPNFGDFSKIVPQGLPLRKDLGYPVGLVIGRLGAGGAVVPIDGIVVDVWGLSNPIGSHIEQTLPSPSGHQKLLPVAWSVAMYVDPAAFKDVPASVAPQDQILAAKHTLECGAVKELMDSATEPMSFKRFWDNLTGAYDRTTLRIPSNPVDAEKKFCK
jgi:arabinofuranosyltransferase